MSLGVPISVVIRTLNAASTLPAVLAGLVIEPGDELIVVDSGSTDATLDIARRRNAKILQIPQAQFTYGRSLNMGFSAARNDWVLTLSSHCIPMPVRGDHLQLFRDAVSRYPEGFAAAAGPFHNTELDRVLMGGVTFYQLEDLAHGFGFPAGNPNCLYRRSCWVQHPFDETVETAEDFEWYFWALKQGYTIAVVHAATARYATARPMKALYRRGQLDRRYARSLLKTSKVRLRGVAVQAVRLFAYWLLGRVSWPTVRNGIAYKCGAWVEGRRE